MLFSKVNLVIDGLDGCGKTTLISNLENSLYHDIPTTFINCITHKAYNASQMEDFRRQDMAFNINRPINKDEPTCINVTNNYASNMYCYMDAYLVGRLVDIMPRSIRYNFVPTMKKQPVLTIYDRGLLSTFFYAYVFTGPENYADAIRELYKEVDAINALDNKKKNSKETERKMIDAMVKTNNLIDSLAMKYISFEHVIRERTKIILNTENPKTTYMTYRDSTIEPNVNKVGKDGIATFRNLDGNSVEHILEALHTDMTYAIICPKSLRDKVISERSSADNDDKKTKYKDIFEKNEKFRDDVTTIYEFFFDKVLVKLNTCGYINPFIGKLVCLPTGDLWYLKDAPIEENENPAKWRTIYDICDMFLDRLNEHLRNNNYTEMMIHGLEKYHKNLAHAQIL